MFIIILLAFGVSYAYFQANIKGNESSNTITTGGVSLKIEYTGSNIINAINILPGWKEVKYFKVDITNPNNKIINYNINLHITNSNFYTTRDIGNSYLTYELYECTDEYDKICTTSIINQTILNINGTGNKIVKQSETTKTETKYYALVINFPNEDYNQTQEGTNGNHLEFNGYVTIESDEKYFYGNLNTYLLSNQSSNNNLEIDNTSDKNIRFTGSTPNNYISFNNELWRIIGVFNVYNVETKQNENLVKIIRNDSLGNYSWDTSDSSINEGYGINEWSQSKLMYELNNDYLGTKNGITYWYDNVNNQKTGIYNYDNNIKDEFLYLVANVRWFTGGASFGNNAIGYYKQERGTTHVSNSTDGVTRTNTWDGKIALMYPSDYGYASKDTGCRNQMANVNCKNENWLFNEDYQLTLTADISNSNYVFRASSSGVLYNYNADLPINVKPVLFLKLDTKLVGGTGTSENPFQIS